MINTRLLRAWPNWLIVPTIICFWIVAGVLTAELLGAQPYHTEQ